MESFAFEAIGTKWHIELDADVESAKEIMQKVFECIERFDKNYSRFREDSLITEMAKTAGTYTLPADAEPLFDLYVDLYGKTEGKVTPLIGETLSQAGYDATYSFTPSALTKPPSWEEVLTYRYPTLTLSKPALLDLGACGKGYLVDIIAEQLRVHGVASYLIDAGGDMRIRQKEGARIGLEHPGDASAVIGVVTLQEGSICGSAGNRRAWEGYTHILDPKTLTSPTSILSVWVVAKTALIADALATCLFFVEPEALSGYAYEYAILNSDYYLKRSKEFPAEFFSS